MDYNTSSDGQSSNDTPINYQEVFGTNHYSSSNWHPIKGWILAFVGLIIAFIYYS